MPELPEVETVKNGLLPLVGHKITQIVTRHQRLRYPLDAKQLNLTHGKTIISIVRRAKYILLTLDNGYLIIHLGMSGRITLFNSMPPSVQKHDHVDIIVGEFTVRYNDPRRFGLVLFVEQLSAIKLLDNLGPEPLTAEFNAKYLFNKLHKRMLPIKQLIMSNDIVVGVGNIYACEALFASKISPLRPSNKLNLKECETLTKNIKLILNHAIKLGGSTLRDHQNTNGEMGYFQQTHKVYAKAGQACSVCGEIIKQVRLGQRSSFYCTSCQH